MNYDANPVWFAVRDPTTSNILSNTGSLSAYIINVTKAISKEASPGSSAALKSENGELDTGDEVIVELPVLDGWQVVAGISTACPSLDVNIFDSVVAYLRNAGGLSGGVGVSGSYDIYDEDESTLLGTYTFEGLVNPFAEGSITKGYSIKAGLTRLIEADCGDYVLDPSAPDHYLRAVLAVLKDRATGNTVDLSEFDYLAIGLQIKDPDTDEIIASVDPEEVTSLPFTGSWTDVISAPASTKTYKAILVLMVNPKQAKRYEADCIIQLGM